MPSSAPTGRSISNAYPALAQPRYRSLDIWRGIACLMIVVMHSALWVKLDPAAQTHPDHSLGTALLNQIRRMGIGVPMFFVISGYCISATADSSRRKSARVSLDYFKRRLRRIFPPYWAIIALTLGLCWILQAAGHANLLTQSADAIGQVPRPASIGPIQWLGNLTLTETWRPHLFGPASNKFIGPSWTLCYEEQFYAVCGLLLLINPARFFRGAAIISLLTLPLAMLHWFTGTLTIDGFFFDGNWLMFAAGVLVYHHLNYAADHHRWFAPAILGIWAVVLAMLRYRWALGVHPFVKQLLFDQLSGAAFALALIVLRPWDRVTCNTRLLAPLAACGKMSYSLYLIHWPIVLLLGQILIEHGIRSAPQVLYITIPLLTATSILCSWIFYQLVERHFLNTPGSPPTRVPAGVKPVLPAPAIA